MSSTPSIHPATQPPSDAAGMQRPGKQGHGKQRPGPAARRFGYLVAVLLNSVLLYAVNVWPGWAAVPFLTADAALVIGVVNASIIVNLFANAAYLVIDPYWFTALGTVLTSVVGFLAAARIWQVFPFDFAGSAFDWAVVARIMLAVAMIGCVIAAITGVVGLVRSPATVCR